MLDRLVGIILTAVGCFGSLMAIVFEFFRVHPEGKRTVSPRTMGLILSCLLLACIGGGKLFLCGGYLGLEMFKDFKDLLARVNVQFKVSLYDLHFWAVQPRSLRY